MGTLKISRSLLILFVMIGIMFLSSCDELGSDDDGEDNTVGFSVIENSVYISLSITGLVNGDEDMTGRLIFYGSNGIQYGTLERFGHSMTIDSDEGQMVLSDAGEEYLFTGGSSIRSIGCIIDANGDSRLSDGDYYTIDEIDYVVTGEDTVDYVFPDDFRQISGSGTMEMNITGLTSGTEDLSGKNVIFGTSGLIFKGTERIIGSGTITGDTFSENLNNGGSDYTFIGTDVIKGVGCIIDMDGNGEAGDGDYFAGASNITITSGVSVDFTFPEDFTEISGSGHITMNISGLSGFSGHDIYYRACKLPFGSHERVGGSETINSDTISVRLVHDGSDVLFPGGSVIPHLQCFIDINDNGTADDGDYRAEVSNVIVNGNMVYEFEY